MAAPRPVVDRYVRITREQPGHIFAPVTVDYRKMQPKLPLIVGAWFAEINQQFLRSPGLFV